MLVIFWEKLGKLLTGICGKIEEIKINTFVEKMSF